MIDSSDIPDECTVFTVDKARIRHIDNKNS